MRPTKQGAHLRVWSQADYFFRLFPLWNWACSHLADAKVRKKSEKNEFLGLRIVKTFAKLIWEHIQTSP